MSNSMANSPKNTVCKSDLIRMRDAAKRRIKAQNKKFRELSRLSVQVAMIQGAAKASTERCNKLQQDMYAYGVQSAKVQSQVNPPDPFDDGGYDDETAQRLMNLSTFDYD